MDVKHKRRKERLGVLPFVDATLQVGDEATSVGGVRVLLELASNVLVSRLVRVDQS